MNDFEEWHKEFRDWSVQYGWLQNGQSSNGQAIDIWLKSYNANEAPDNTLKAYVNRICSILAIRDQLAC